MRILLITNKVPYPPKDGGAIATFNMAKGLAELNNEVTILSLNTNKHYCNLKGIPQNILDRISFIAVDINTDLSAFSALKNLFFSKLPYNAERFISRDFEEKITEVLKNNSFDIIQLEGLYLGPYIETIRKSSQSVITYRAHNIEYEIWQRTLNQEANKLKKQYLKLLSKRIERMERQIINKYDALVPITARDAKKLEELGNVKPYIVSQTGFDLQKIDNVSSSEIDFPSIFHIGSLDWAPNQEGLLWFIDNCWDEIKRRVPSLKFYIAGRNAPDWFISKMKKDGIIFEGEVDDAYKFMERKAVMIVPLLSGSGMRIKVIEGMALGKAIITTSIGIEGINAENNKQAIVADSPDDFTESCIALMADRALVERIGAKAKEFIMKNFDNLAIAKKLLEFYKTL